MLSVQCWKPLPNLRSHRFSPAFSYGDAFYFSHLVLGSICSFLLCRVNLDSFFSPLHVIDPRSLVRSSTSPRDSFAVQQLFTRWKMCLWVCSVLLSAIRPGFLSHWSCESVSDVSPSALWLILRISLTLLGSLHFQVNFRITASIPEKILQGSDWHCIEPICVTVIAESSSSQPWNVPLSRSALVSVSEGLYFWVQEPWTSFVRFIPIGMKWLSLFYALLPVYRKAIAFLNGDFVSGDLAKVIR